MRTGPPADLLASALSYEVRVDSRLGARTLAEDIPVVGGTISVDSTSQVIESATVAVPAVGDDGTQWTPRTPRAPLARYGQQLTFTAVMGDGTATWETPLGVQAIQDWTDSLDVEVACAGPLQAVADARLPRPLVPRKGGTLMSELRRLMIGGIPVDISEALPNRGCPASFEWDEDRLQAIYEIVNGWPAVIVPDGFGGIRVLPDVSADAFTPVLTYADGEGGTVVSAPRSDTRRQAYNHVVARAQSDDLDAPLIQGEAEVTTGPMAVAAYGRVTRFFSSPTLRTAVQCRSAASSLLEKAQRPARALAFTAPVDPRVELYDPLRVIFDGDTYDGHVIGYKLPLKPGDMEVTVGLLT